MFFSLELLLLSLPFVTSNVVLQLNALKFVYPEPGKFNYDYADGDKVIVEWTPKTKLATVLLNCSSSAMLNGATDSQVEFINANSGVLYHVRESEDNGEKKDTYCAFCAGSEPQTCSGVFRVIPRTEGIEPKVWTSITVDTSISPRKPTYEDLAPPMSKETCTTLTPTPLKKDSYPTVPPSLAGPNANTPAKDYTFPTPKGSSDDPSSKEPPEDPAPKPSPSPSCTTNTPPKEISYPTVPPALYGPISKTSPKETPSPIPKPSADDPSTKEPPKEDPKQPSPPANCTTKTPPKEISYPTIAPPSSNKPTGETPSKEIPKPKGGDPTTKEPPKEDPKQPSPANCTTKTPPKENSYPTLAPPSSNKPTGETLPKEEPKPKDQNPTTPQVTCPTPPRPYGERNTSVPLITPAKLPPATSLPPNPTYPTNPPCLTDAPPGGKEPYTTVTVSKYNRTGPAPTGGHASTLLLKITPSGRMPTASQVGMPKSTLTPIQQSDARWRANVDFGVMWLGLLAVGFFVYL